jgi:succinylglutamate desuccinylase
MIGTAELAEQRDLLAAIRAEVRSARGPIYVLDLHTTSSESIPFTTLGDTLQNRALALALPIPVVLGLEEQIDGAMLQYFDRLGWRSIGVEGGAHGSEASVDAHEDAVWLILDDLGIIPADRHADIRRRRTRLGQETRGLPRVVDVRYRHEISPSDGFAMKPGYRNFAPIRALQALGTDRNGPVLAPLRGRVFLPLYQKQGDDGFFVVRRVHPAWLAVSRTLRRAGADRFATWIPGVQHHPSRSDAVILAPWARNRLVIGILHLMGFNARRERGSLLMIRRIESPNPDPTLDPGL